MTIFSVSRNGETPLAATHPAAIRWENKHNLPLEAGVYERDGHVFTIVDISNHSIADMKKELRAKAKAKFESEIEEKYTALEIACLTALQTEKFAIMKTYIAPRVEALVAKLAKIDACTTYDQLENLKW
jgi:hypothetical protein